MNKVIFGVFKLSQDINSVAKFTSIFSASRNEQRAGLLVFAVLPLPYYAEYHSLAVSRPHRVASVRQSQPFSPFVSRTVGIIPARPQRLHFQTLGTTWASSR